MTSNHTKTNEAYNFRSELYEWFEAIVFSVVTVVIVFTFIFRVVGVEGESMKNTLNDRFVRGVNEIEDRVILSNLFYEPQRGDIVVCAIPGDKPIIKRVIGVGGDVVNIDPMTGDVYVNDQLISEPYKLDEAYIPSSSYTTGPVKIEEGYVYVLGDNRNNSKDSRFAVVGPVKVEYIIGKALFRIYPFDRIGKLYD